MCWFIPQDQVLQDQSHLGVDVGVGVGVGVGMGVGVGVRVGGVGG